MGRIDKSLCRIIQNNVPKHSAFKEVKPNSLLLTYGLHIAPPKDDSTKRGKNTGALRWRDLTDTSSAR